VEDSAAAVGEEAAIVAVAAEVSADSAAETSVAAAQAEAGKVLCSRRAFARPINVVADL
jgi:hypothetical protein